MLRLVHGSVGYSKLHQTLVNTLTTTQEPDYLAAQVRHLPLMVLACSKALQQQAAISQAALNQPNGVPAAQHWQQQAKAQQALCRDNNWILKLLYTPSTKNHAQQQVPPPGHL